MYGRAASLGGIAGRPQSGRVVSFLAIAFLAGLAALAVPLWLHRMNERAAAETTISSLMLMRETEEPVRTRRTLAHRVLLALRLAFLALIALAFAQPVLETAAGSGDDDRAVPAKLIVLDGSLSMRRAEVWAEALATAGSLLESGTSRVVLAGSRLALVSELEAATPSWARLDFAGLPNRLDAVLATLPEPPGGWHIHIVSDFQASAVPDRFNALVEGTLWPLALHRVGAAEDNWAVEAAIVDGDRVAATVASYAARGRNLAVALGRAGDDAERQRIDVSVSAGTRRNVTFPIPAAGRERVAWEVALDASDAVPEDDVAWAIQGAVDAAAVVLVAPNADAAALRFLTAALEASGVANPIRVEDAAWPRSASAAIVLDPGQLPTATKRRLERYLANGGGALLIAGERSQRHGALPVGGALTGSVVAGARRVVAVDDSHPIARGSWEDVSIRRTVALAASPGDTILALAATGAEARGVQADAPLLVEKRLGKGRALILLTALDREWGSLVLQPAFVGLVGNAVDYLARNPTPSAKAGEAVAIPAASVQIFDAQGQRVLALDETTRRPVVRIDRPGVYTVRTPGRVSSMAVHVDTRESNLQPASADFLSRWQALGAGARGKAALAEQAAVPPAAADANAETSLLPLAPWLLALAAALLLVESVAANLGRFDFRLLSFLGAGRG